MPYEAYDDDNKCRGIPLVTEDARKYLNPRQEVAYREFRRDLIEWMLDLGKDPDKAEGYAETVVKNRVNKIDIFYRWVWDQEGRYVQDLTPDHADQWMEALAHRDLAGSTKAYYQKSVKSLFKWQREARGRDVEWDPEISYSDPSTSYQPRDYLTREDRRKLREAAMSYGSVPHYNNVTGEEREKWEKYLAQRFEKPKTEIGKPDFERANSFKYPSMIYTALDAGLRPCEVERANLHWIDTDNSVLRIPRDESSKNRENWIVALKPETAQVLKRWMQEREQYERYEGRDAVWLTKYGNRYGRNAFRNVFRRVAKEADLDLEGRDLTPYSIRHSTGNYVSDEADLATVAKQLRHKSKRSSEKYAHSSMEQQTKAINRID